MLAVAVLSDVAFFDSNDFAVIVAVVAVMVVNSSVYVNSVTLAAGIDVAVVHASCVDFVLAVA